eukprot:3097677-Rhodomonas_salina.1
MTMGCGGGGRRRLRRCCPSAARPGAEDPGSGCGMGWMRCTDVSSGARTQPSRPHHSDPRSEYRAVAGVPGILCVCVSRWESRSLVHPKKQTSGRTLGGHSPDSELLMLSTTFIAASVTGR